MAYIDRFIFRFNSVSGKSVRIVIADDDYTGAAVERRLGGSPQLRCELSGNIRGMSLEIPAECKVDDEFAVLYTSDPTRFAVRVEMDNTVVWRGFVTPELYAAPWVDPPYDVQITATDGLGELKMKEWPAIGSRTLKEILDTVLGATGLALGIRMISAAANDIATAADLLTGTTVNLDHMAGKSYYDVLDGLLGSLHCTISQMDGAWLLVRETDVTALTSGGQVSDTTGRTYPVKAFGSSRSNDCWPVGRLTTEIVPAKSVVEVECPNHLASLIADPDMELNLWQTNGSWTGEDGGYYTLDLNEYISQVITVANASRDADPGFRIKVSSRHTTPFGVGIMRLTVMATGRDPRSGSDKTLYLKEVTTQGRTQLEWVTEESHFDDGLGLPKTLDHQDCKEFVTDIFRLPTSFNPLKSVTVKVTAGKSTVCVHSVHIECMSVYDKAVTRLVMDNGARGDESNSPLFADSFVGNKGNFLLSNSPKGVTGALVGTWSSEAIPSVPYGEWLSKDMALSVATPRLRMSGRLFTVTSLPALFYSNKGLSYITEEWSLDLIEDEADISLISLPAAALSTVSVSVIVEDNDGRTGTVSGGEIISPKTGDSSSGSGYLDWFIAESYEADGETKYRLKLNPKYEGMYAEGWVSAGGVSDQGGGGGGTGYLRDLLDVNASMSPTQGQALVWDDALGKWTAGDVSVDLTPFERIANRVTTVSSSSNHTQYPTAKAVYDIVNTMLSSAMRFQGVTSTALVDGSTTNPVVVDGASYTATRGDVVVRSDVGLEYLWTGARWQQLGDETSYAKKTVTITGSGYLTGGGNLEAARTIDIADAVKTKINNGATAFSYFTDGAANEAIKLRTPRTIWGQSFDGSGNVDGNITINGKAYVSSGLSVGTNYTGVSDRATLSLITSGNYPNDLVLGSSGQRQWSITSRSSDENNSLGLFSYVSGKFVLYANHSGNIGFGTESPAYKLDVSGDSRISGKVYIGKSGGYLEVVNVGTTASPVYALKSSLPFFSDSWVSAGGVSSTGSGGGITGYLKDLLDVNGSMIPVDGQALVWDSSLGDNGRWTSKNVSVDLTPFERTTNKVTGISASSTDGQYPSARAVYNSLSGYLPLTGGTLTGLLRISSGNDAKIILDNTDNETNYQQIVFSQNGTEYARLGTFSNTILRWQIGEANYIIWHEGNDGAGSGLDADLLDGQHGSYYATAASVTTATSNITTLQGYFTNGVANSATKLQTARSIWGQNFDGSGNVDGNITVNGKAYVSSGLSVGTDYTGVSDRATLSLITSGNYPNDLVLGSSGQRQWSITSRSSDENNSLGLFSYVSGKFVLYANHSGNIGFDTTSPAYTLDVNGIIRGDRLIGTATGITETSLEDEEFTYQATPINDIADGYRVDKIKGKTLAWNQQVINGDFSNGTANWYANQGTATVASNELTYICSAGTGARVQFSSAPGVAQSGHVYYMRFDYKSTISFNFQWLFGPGQNLPSASSWSKFTKIGQANSSSAYYSAAYFYNYSSLSAGAWTLNLRNVNVFDLTLMFGAGNEPSTADEFESMFPETYYDYTVGELINNSVEAIETEAVDSSWTSRLALGLGSIKVKDSSGDILELNGLAAAGDVYDEIISGKMRSPVCRVRLSDLSWGGSLFNGHMRFEAALPESPRYSYWTITNAINSCGWANGANPITDNAQDKTIGVYSNNHIFVRDDRYGTVEEFVAAMEGQWLYYERATPVTYDLVSSVPLSGRIDGNGTMRVISDGPVAPFRGDITYGCNPGQMGADASSVKSYLDNMLEIKVVDGVPMLHTTLPFYSDSFVSAGGLSGTGGSGSGSSLRDLSDVQLPETITTGSALVYNGEKWVQSDAAFVPQTRTVNGLELSSNISLSLGDLSNVNTAGASNGQSLVYYDGEWVPSGSGSGFLPLSGGSMTGTINMQTGSLTSTNTYKFTHTENGSEIFDAYFGANTNGLAAIYARNGIALRPTNANNKGLVVTGTDMTYNGATILKAAVNTPGMVQVSVVSSGDLTTLLQIAESNTGISALDGKYRYYPVNISSDNKLYVHIPWYSGSGSGGSGSSVAYVPSLTSGTLIGTLKIDGSSYGLYAPAGGSGSASWGSTSKNTSPLTVGGTTKTVMLAGAATARDSSPTINTGGTTANRYYGVELSNDGKLFVNVPWIEGGGSTGSYLPLAGGTMTGTINSQSVIAKSNNAYDLGSSGKYYANTYTKKIYLDDGVYIYYDSTNRVIRVQGAGIAATGSVNAGGVSNT